MRTAKIEPDLRLILLRLFVDLRVSVFVCFVSPKNFITFLFFKFWFRLLEISATNLKSHLKEVKGVNKNSRKRLIDDLYKDRICKLLVTLTFLTTKLYRQKQKTENRNLKNGSIIETTDCLNRAVQRTGSKYTSLATQNQKELYDYE